MKLVATHFLIFIWFMVRGFITLLAGWIAVAFVIFLTYLLKYIIHPKSNRINTVIYNVGIVLAGISGIATFILVSKALF